MNQIHDGFGLYDVPGVKQPLVITHEHAKEIKGAKLHNAADAGSDAPTTVKDILAAVGDDPEKAAAALEAENAKGDDARASLVAKLEAVVSAGDEA